MTDWHDPHAHHLGPWYPPRQARTFTGAARMALSMAVLRSGKRLSDWLWPGDTWRA